MKTKSKILLAIGIVLFAGVGFVLTKYLTRNTRKIVGGTVTLQNYETPPSQEPLS